MKGKVYLVGAGPGDPELLTLKALRLLQTADAVLHDDLVAPEILKLIVSTAQVHNVGKRCGKKKILQEEINFLMVALADSGLRVVRLKCGDPLIFGRAGEEIESLRRANIPFEIVPGVTSSMGAAAAGQIPLTHRRASSALVFMTAHQAKESEAANWSKLAGSGATLVIYMPGQDYSALATRLKGAGVTDATPCAIISRATMPPNSERTVRRLANYAVRRSLLPRHCLSLETSCGSPILWLLRTNSPTPLFLQAPIGLFPDHLQLLTSQPLRSLSREEPDSPAHSRSDRRGSASG